MRYEANASGHNEEDYDKTDLWTGGVLHAIVLRHAIIKTNS